MGRPLNKRYMGQPTPGGNEIKVRFYDSVGTAEVEGWIVKQLGARRFRVTDGLVTEDCILTDNAVGATSVGEMTISVKLDDTTIEPALKVSAHKATVDVSGTTSSVGWTFDDSAIDSKLEMPEAGGPAPIIVTAMIGTTEYRILTLGTTNNFAANGATEDTDGAFTIGVEYVITALGTTDFVAIGASADTVGVIFTATGIGGAGAGTAIQTTFTATAAGTGDGTVIATSPIDGADAF